MKKFINKLTGGEMWVADSRAKEYTEAGHKPVSGFISTEKISPMAARMQKRLEEIKASEKVEAEKPKPIKTKPLTKKGRK